MKSGALFLALALGFAVPAGAQTAAAPAFSTLGAGEMFASKLKGLNIYNQDNKNIGEIEDVAMNASGTVDAFIVSVGGFLGMGERYVALDPKSVNVAWDGSAKKWTAKMNATADQLKAAPEFKYPK